MFKKIKLLVFFSILSVTVMSQGIRFSFQGGLAIPTGEFAKNVTHPENGGFATNGFDIKLIGERIYKNKFIVGVNLGFTLFGVDKEAIQMVINPSDPSTVHVESQSFQNINLQARGGYYFSFMDEKMSLIPFVDVGMGVFNSAYYAISKPNGTILVREGNAAVALLITPGLEYSVAINEIVSIKLFGNYQFADYSVDEHFRLIDVNTPNPLQIDKTVNYKYTNASVGLGLAFVL